MNKPKTEANLGMYYESLFAAWGPQHWWPARSRFEVIAGAYLTQNTAWSNVEHALRRLRKAGLLSPRGIRETPLLRLQSTIRPAGYFRQKARSLKAFVSFLDGHYGGSLRRMFAQPTTKLRLELLELKGVGPETADSILLYAGQHSVCVVDSYTRRILDRHDILPMGTPYEEVRALLERALGDAHPVPSPIGAGEKGGGQQIVNAGGQTLRGGAHSPSPMSRSRRSAKVQIFNEMHGLIVTVGKNYCLKSKAKCDGCPLQQFLPRTE